MGLLENLGHVGSQLLHEVAHRADVPEEDTRVPHKFAALHKEARIVHGRFLLKTLHAVQQALLDGIAHLDVAVGSIGHRGRGSHGHKDGMGGHVRQAIGDFCLEAVGINDLLVGRRENYDSLGVVQADVVVGPDGGWRSGKLHRLQQDILLRHFGQLLLDHLGIVLVGGDEDMVGGQQGGKAVERLLQERAARAKEINELFGPIFTTHGP